MSNIEIKVDMVGSQMDCAVIQVKGLIDTDTSRHLSKALEDTIANRHYKIVMDLSDTDYISSAGWGIFIGELRKIRRHQGDLKLAGLIPEVEKIYKMLEYYDIIKNYTTVTDAIKDFG